MFPNLTYTKPPTSLFPRKIPTAFIYTMNVSEQQMKEVYASHIKTDEHVLKMIFGQSETLSSNETLQFEDYDKIVFSYFDPEERKERHRTVFLQDCRRAFDLGAQLGKSRKQDGLKSGTAGVKRRRRTPMQASGHARRRRCFS